MTDQFHGGLARVLGHGPLHVGGRARAMCQVVIMVASISSIGSPWVAICRAEDSVPQPTQSANGGSTAAISARSPDLPAESRPGKHPLMPVLRLAEEMKANIDKNIRDYTASLSKRGRMNGKLSDLETMSVKIRHERVRDGKVIVPFSVYIRFVSPPAIKGREVLYLAGQNNGDMLVQESQNQLLGRMFSTTALKPNGMLAMRGNRYPITEIGLQTLLQRLIEVAREDIKRGECKVTYFEGAKVAGRSCRCLQVVHPVRRDYFRYHRARIFVDDELNLPIRYASYDWPSRSGDDPPLIEEYTYVNLRLNVGLTDRDFDQTNPAYNFK
jgi:hypothetical protein